MPAPKGNQFWKARSSHGRNPTFESPEQLWNCCVEYFEWVEDNPIEEEKAFCYQGEVFKDTVFHIHAMTQRSLCFFLRISEETWSNFRKKEDFIGVIREVEQVIYNQKFAGAAANQLNANIIARDLGLAERHDNTHTGADGGPIAITEVKRTIVDPKST